MVILGFSFVCLLLLLLFCFVCLLFFEGGEEFLYKLV